MVSVSKLHFPNGLNFSWEKKNVNWIADLTSNSELLMFFVDGNWLKRRQLALDNSSTLHYIITDQRLCFKKVRVYELLQILCLYVTASDTYIDSIPVNRTVYLTFAVSIVTCCSVPVISMYMYWTTCHELMWFLV